MNMAYDIGGSIAGLISPYIGTRFISSAVLQIISCVNAQSSNRDGACV